MKKTYHESFHRRAVTHAADIDLDGLHDDWAEPPSETRHLLLHHSHLDAKDRR